MFAVDATVQRSADGGDEKTVVAKTVVDPVKTPTKVDAASLAPRFEFGKLAEDFQLQQAMNQLKGQPVIGAVKSMQAAARADKP